MSETILTDQDLMPFGYHKGKKMEDVPVKWLNWYYSQPGKKNDRYCPVCIYIRNNIVALMKENEDLIWE